MYKIITIICCITSLNSLQAQPQGYSPIAVQNDGKIIQAGSMNYTSDNPMDFGYAFGIIRYNENGSIDRSFGKNGKVITKIHPGGLDLLRALAIQSDDKIVVTGSAQVTTGHYSNNHFIVVRYKPNGELDSTFGENGIVRTVLEKEDNAYCLAIQPDGKIVVAGDSQLSAGAIAISHVRYNGDGSLDKEFGNRGKTVTIIGTNPQQHELLSKAFAIQIQKDGKIITSGSFNNGNSTGLLVIRQNADGSLDNDFGNSGKVQSTLLPVAEARSIVLQGDKIVIAGRFMRGNDPQIFLARLTNDGSLDKTFGINGISKIPEEGKDHFPFRYEAYAAGILSDGKIITSGVFENEKLTFLKFNSNGIYDHTMPPEHYRKLQKEFFSNHILFGHSLVVLKNNKILIGGNTPALDAYDIKKEQLRIIRLNSNGTLDKTFGINGFTSVEM